MTPDERQTLLDEEHLRLLSLFHYISGGITVAFSLLFAVWLAFMGLILTFAPFPAQAGPQGAPIPHGPPAVVLVVFGFLFLLLLAYGVLEIFAGRWMSRRRRRVLTILVALPRLLFLPYGIILSIFTLLVLERPTVRQLYGPP